VTAEPGRAVTASPDVQPAGQDARAAARDTRPAARDVRPAGSRRRAARIAAVLVPAVLAAAVAGWAAVPVHGGGPGTRAAILAAAACTVLTAGQLALQGLAPVADPSSLAAERAVLNVAWLVAAGPWPEGLVVSAVALEALHRARPWHTAVLAAGLLAVLLAVHVAETGVALRALRPQLPLLGGGLALIAVSAGLAQLPGLGTGPGALALRMLAVAAAVLAGFLAAQD
jgi:hypothetical protein